MSLERGDAPPDREIPTALPFATIWAPGPSERENIESALNGGLSNAPPTLVARVQQWELIE
jgi:hypothetical protein